MCLRLAGRTLRQSGAMPVAAKTSWAWLVIHVYITRKMYVYIYIYTHIDTMYVCIYIYEVCTISHLKYCKIACILLPGDILKHRVSNAIKDRNQLDDPQRATGDQCPLQEAKHPPVTAEP